MQALLCLQRCNQINAVSLLIHKWHLLARMMLRWALFVTYTIIQSITSSEMCSLHLTHPSAHTPGAVGSRRCGARGAVLGVRCLAQGSHLSRGQFLSEPRFEPTTSGYKSDALSTRATTACVRESGGEWICVIIQPIFVLFCSNVLRRWI